MGLFSNLKSDVSSEGWQQREPYCLACVTEHMFFFFCSITWCALSFWKHVGDKQRPSHGARMWPQRYRSAVTKLWGGGKFTKHHMRWQKSTNSPSQPASLFSSPSALTPNRKAKLLRREHGTSPGDRYVTPPKTLWHNYTSVALKGEGRREEEEGGEGEVGTEREWVSERKTKKKKKKWRVCRVGGAAGCFTPGLFKETAQGMPLVLLTKHFFFLQYCWVRSSQILWAPVSPPQPFEDASETFSRRHLGLFQRWCFQWIIQHCCGHAEGLLGTGDWGWMADTCQALSSGSPSFTGWQRPGNLVKFSMSLSWAQTWQTAKLSLNANKILRFYSNTQFVLNFWHVMTWECLIRGPWR